jgi:hypothetical protein
MTGPVAPIPFGPVGFDGFVVLPSPFVAPVAVPGISPVAPANGAPDLVTQAFSRVITQYRNKPKLAATLLAVAYVFQDIVNAAAFVPFLDDFDHAGGVNLDVTAGYVGQSRILGGYTVVSDDFLRILARLRIIRNHSSGTGPEIIAAVASLLGNDGTPINYLSPGQMYADVQIQRQPTALETAAVDSDLLPRPAGVDLVVSWFLTARHFGWDEDLSVGAKGFSEEGDDTTGGCFAEIV